jgi:hypothetical protein
MNTKTTLEVPVMSAESAVLSFTSEELVTLLWAGTNPLESGALGWLLCAPDRDDVATIRGRGLSSLGAHRHLPGIGIQRSLSTEAEAISLVLRTASSLVLYRSATKTLLVVLSGETLSVLVRQSMPNVFEFRLFVPERSIDEQIAAQLDAFRTAGVDNVALSFCESLQNDPIELTLDDYPSAAEAVQALMSKVSLRKP